MNVIEWIDAHKGCPLSLLIAHCEDQYRRQTELLGKAFYLAVLDMLEPRMKNSENNS